MRLCINCVNYDDSSAITKCLEDYWVVSDKVKSKIFNPMMFECFDYEGTDDSNNFEDDHLFDLFLTMSR